MRFPLRWPKDELKKDDSGGPDQQPTNRNPKHRLGLVPAGRSNWRRRCPVLHPPATRHQGNGAQQDKKRLCQAAMKDTKDHSQLGSGENMSVQHNAQSTKQSLQLHEPESGPTHHWQGSSSRFIAKPSDSGQKHYTANTREKIARAFPFVPEQVHGKSTG